MAIGGDLASTTPHLQVRPRGPHGSLRDLLMWAALAGATALIPMMVMLICAGPRRRRAYATACALAVMAVVVTACSESSTAPCGPVTSTFMVTGTSGPLMESTPVTVTVE